MAKKDSKDGYKSEPGCYTSEKPQKGDSEVRVEGVKELGVLSECCSDRAGRDLTR